MAERRVEFLLIGGGLASGNCARWLREEGADGSILLVGREPDLPYNRPECSKGYLQGKEGREDTFFRPPEWYERAVRRGAHAGDGAKALGVRADRGAVERRHGSFR